MGKQSALFVPSGTMANQIAIRSLTRPGDVLLAGESAHVLRYESGGASALWGVQIQTVGRGGLFDDRELHAAIPMKDAHLAPATAVALENTHNVSGGRAWPVEQLEAVAAAAHERGLRVHLDGARIFNAAHASRVDPARIAAVADTVSFCLSKGLGAPIGSLVCCDEALLPDLHRTRKMLGGGMRQAGIVAAAGLFALDHHVERLAEDHENARLLAEGLASCGLELPHMPETNLVVFGVPEGRFARIPDAPALSRAAREHDLLIDPLDRRRLRAVTHLDVSAEAIREALERIRALLA
jgi:threonine aldolase